MRKAAQKMALIGGSTLLLLGVVYGGHAAVGFYTVGDSMLPMIAVGTRIAVNKLNREPGRGRAIIFRGPTNPPREYIKRIVGLAGDTISANGAEIILNGTPIPHCRVGAWSYTDADGQRHGGEIWTEMLEGAKWLVFHDAAASVQPAGPWTVAPREVFVLGDNRENSSDSRKWFGGKGGGLPLSSIVGAAIGTGTLTLPKGAEHLQTALDQCVAELSR